MLKNLEEERVNLKTLFALDSFEVKLREIFLHLCWVLQITIEVVI